MKRRLTALTRLNAGKWMRATVTLCATVLLALAVQMPADAQTLTTLHSFVGSGPQAGLVQAANGDLWGTLSGGSAFGSSVGGVFKISPSGGATATRRLDAINASAPLAGLVLATDGNFYGTAAVGGANNGGAIFKLTPNGVLTTLYSFCAITNGCLDGAGPTTLFQGANSNLYGITQGGGAGQDRGTIFTITLSGALTTLYSFCTQGNPCSDGNLPEGLVQGTDGNLYGTTLSGGAHDEGTVFQLTPSHMLTTLYNFCTESGCKDGSTPLAGLVQGADGSFYGTTKFGGARGEGMVFKITSSGALTTLHSFDGTDGNEPAALLIQATDGNFYGTTFTSGLGFSNDPGTVFQMTPGGALTMLYTFCAQSGCTDGFIPQALVQYTDGNFYGTTSEGSANDCGSNFGCGTVFSFATGLGAFVRTLPTSGNVGTQVRILGSNLTGASSVSFNGTAASFKVMSSSLAITTVPAGATTGEVTVVTSSGILSSNVAFQVN